MRDEQQHHKNLAETLRQITGLLERQALVSGVVSRTDTPRQELVQGLVARQHLAELERRLNQLHPADTAFVLEGLPVDLRSKAWQLIAVQRRGVVLLEVSDTVRESLIADLGHGELVQATQQMDGQDVADLVQDLPKDVVREVLLNLDSDDRARLDAALSFPPGTVGALMDLDTITVRDDFTLDAALRHLRKRGNLPEQLNEVFVVGSSGALTGLLSMRDLILTDPEVPVGDAMRRDPLFFFTDDPASDAAEAFERYDMITAPVVNFHHQVVGRVTVDAVLDYVKLTSQKMNLKRVGLSEDEDLFAPLIQSGKNRWPWLVLNLMTAFAASRVIGVFEDSIAKLSALAALMPIVASIGGNTGNQTVALIIRGLALNQVHAGNLRFLVLKEMGIGLMNGALWGSVMGVFVLLLYKSWSLSLVMAVAMTLNLVVASLAGIFAPMLLQRMGRDPVMGSSIMLTATTDSMGFFIFLGLATVFLL